MFAAAITLGLFRWELWNIKKCRLFIHFADALESRVRSDAGIKTKVRSFNPPDGIGKREAEKFIYPVTILAWLVVPFVLGDKVTIGDTFFYIVYFTIAIPIAVAAFISMFVPREIDPDLPKEENSFRVMLKFFRTMPGVKRFFKDKNKISTGIN